MGHWLDQINSFIEAHAYLGGLFAFLIAFAESLPILGTIIPGSITMTFIGILIGRNLLPIGSTFFLAVIGALIGDVIGFWLGKHYHARIPTIWPFRKYPKMLALGEAFFKKHGGKSIIIGRFIGPTRSSVPMIAGLLKMRWAKFIVATIPSAILWAFVYLMPGVLIGAISLELPKGKATTFTLAGLLGIVILWLIFWAVQRFFIYIASKTNRAIDRCWRWLNHHHSSQHIINMITNKQDPYDHRQLALLIGATISLILFIVAFLSVLFKTALFNFNYPVFHFLQTLRGIHTDSFFVIMTMLGDKYVIAAISVIVCVVLGLRHQWYALWHFAMLVFLAFSSAWILKHIYYSARPNGFMLVNSESSFPSGHSVLAVSIIGFLSFLFAQCVKEKYRWIVYTFIGIVLFLVCLSRLYLGAHWFCDVFAGACLALTLLLLVIISYRRWQPPLRGPKSLAIMIALITFFPFAASSALHFHKNLYEYKPYLPERQVAIKRWWKNPENYLPVYRLGRLGKPAQPFNIQWAGDIASIERELTQKGWLSVASTQNLKSTIDRLASKAPENHLAFLPQLYRNKKPVLIMIRHLANQQIIVLKLWKTGISFEDSPLAIYVGSSNYHHPIASLLTLHPIKQITLRHGGGINELSSDIQQNYATQFVTNKNKFENSAIQHLHWDHKILIIAPKNIN